MAKAKKSKLNFGLIVIIFASLLVIGPIFWKYVIRPPLARNEAWSGTLLERSEKRRGGNYRHTLYYLWKVKCDDGKTRTVDVDNMLWLSADPGDRVEKRKGERYPRLAGRSGLNMLKEQMGEDFPEKYEPLVPVEE